MKQGYKTKILGLSVAWHALLFICIGTATNPLLTVNKDKQSTVFLGSLLSQSDLLPNTQVNYTQLGNAMNLVSSLQDKIDTDKIPKLAISPLKPPIVTKEKVLEPAVNDLYFSNKKTHNALKKTDVVELFFNVNSDKHKINQYKLIPESCEFRYTLLENNTFLWVERLTSTGDPELDMDLIKFINESLLYSPQQASSKIKVNLSYH